MRNNSIEVFVTNGNLRENIELLKENGYNYIIKACDKSLSGWGGAKNTKHLQLIACKDSDELNAILESIRNDKSFNYIDWNRIENYTRIYNWTRNKSWTLRNDWRY